MQYVYSQIPTFKQEMIQNFDLKSMKKIHHLEDVGTIKEDITEVECEAVDCIHLTQEGVRHRLFMNVVINLLIP
jgi:hypothetical protein